MLRPVPALVASLAALAFPAAAPAAAVKVTDGVQYGTGQVGAPEAAQAPLLLDLYGPAKRASGRRPVVILIHGGGFRQQTRKDPGIVRIARGLAGRGIVAASIDYRLLPQNPAPSSRVAHLTAAMPDQPLFRAVSAAVDDTLTAIDYLKSHAASLGIDPGRLGLVGSSAGAITANHVAYALDDHGIARPKVAFVGSLWGAVLVPPGAKQLDRGEAPLFAVHGTADTTLPVRNSDDLVARARAQGVHGEYLRIRGGKHGYGPSRFFTAKVVGRETPFDRLLDFATARLKP